MFIISTLISLLYLLISIFISINWINDIACYLGYFLAIYLVVFIALIPGFIYAFMLTSLLHDKKEDKKCSKKEFDVTVLIPVYNGKDCIINTIKSIKKQKYYGDINIIVIDDGSTDGTLELLKEMDFGCNIKILETPHRGKSFALNEGLKHVKADYV